jgi:phosphoglycerate dehydrogenase-like enzyme
MGPGSSHQAALGRDDASYSPKETKMTKPKVLISDALSPAAVQIFRDRGVEVDFQPNLGKDKEKLAEIIGKYDGLAIRSATKATAKIIEKATRLRVIGRAGIGVDNVEIPAATAKGIIVMNTPFGNSITTAEHAITLMLALAKSRRPMPPRKPESGRRTASWVSRSPARRSA